LAQQYSQALGLTATNLHVESPLIVTGHQAQFYHCGILIKYFLADFLGRAFATCPINLIVDSDLPRNLSLNLPVQGADGLSCHSLSWQGMDQSIPLEHQPLPSKRQMEQWFDSLERLELLPVLRERVELIRKVMEPSYRQARNLVEFYTLVNHTLAQSLSLNWLELPVSQFCETQSFWAFVGDLVVKSHVCHQSYNDALRDFRQENNLRNPSQPLPDLGGGHHAKAAREMPFWVFRPQQPRRALWVSQEPGRWVFSDGQEELGVMDLGAERSSQKVIDDLQRIFTQQNISLRPRALTLTIFTRLFFADYFIHGIGGARYERVTDRFIRKFYGCDPPAFACASATVRLPFESGKTVEVIDQKLRVNRRRYRDLSYNPQRFISTDHSGPVHEWMSRREDLIGESDRLRQTQAGSGRRSEVFREIRQMNSLLAQENVEAAKQVERQRTRLLTELNDAQVMADREYFFGLFEPEKLGVLRCEKT